MKSQFRATTPADGPAIAGLLQAVFGCAAGEPLIDPQMMQWKYWSPHPYWEGSRSYVLERDGRIAAHGAAVPGICRFGGQRFRAFHLIDWAAEAGASGSGVSLFNRLLQSAEASYVAGGSDITRRLLPALGFRDMGTVTRFARPLRPWKRRVENWRDAARIARAGLWTLPAPGTRVTGWSARQLRSAELAAVDWPRPKDAPGLAVMERTPELSAFFLESQAVSMNFYIVEQAAAPRGYFMLSFTPGQARIVDCWMADPAEWRAAYLLAVGCAAEHPDVTEVTTLASLDAARQALEQAGFRRRGESPLRFFSKRPELVGVSKFHFQMLDSDAAYMHARNPHYWS